MLTKEQVATIVKEYGKKENDSSYFFFKDMDAKAPIDFFAIGALEMEECALAFCFDWKRKKINIS